MALPIKFPNEKKACIMAIVKHFSPENPTHSVHSIFQATVAHFADHPAVPGEARPKNAEECAHLIFDLVNEKKLRLLTGNQNSAPTLIYVQLIAP